MFVFTGYAVDQSRVDVEEEGPNFMTATLTLFLETQRAVRDVKAPIVFGTRRFLRILIHHSPGTPPGPNNGVGPGGKW